MKKLLNTVYFKYSNPKAWRSVRAHTFHTLVPCYTDYPQLHDSVNVFDFAECGMLAEHATPIMTPVLLLSYDGDKYCQITYFSEFVNRWIVQEIKAGYLYKSNKLYHLNNFRIRCCTDNKNYSQNLKFHNKALLNLKAKIKADLKRYNYG